MSIDYLLGTCGQVPRMQLNCCCGDVSIPMGYLQCDLWLPYCDIHEAQTAVIAQYAQHTAVSW